MFVCIKSEVKDKSTLMSKGTLLSLYIDLHLRVNMYNVCYFCVEIPSSDCTKLVRNEADEQLNIDSRFERLTY